jgi:hypothetical protein
MRRTILAAIVVAACVFGAGLIGVAVLGGWAPASTAQIIDSNDCERACYAQESACSRACGKHINPVECEAKCHDVVEDCLRECR